MPVDEATIEQAVLSCAKEPGYAVLPGAELAPEAPGRERPETGRAE